MSEGQEIAERHDPEVVAIAAPAPASGSPPAAIIFIAALIVAMLTFGSSLALLTRVAPLAVTVEDEVEIVRGAAPTRTGTAAPTSVRVAAASGNAQRLEAGTYRVTFLWTLEGARQGDSVVLRFSAGSRVLPEQRGMLDANTFTASTGRFTVSTSQDCSAEGWGAELVTIRGVAATGETTSRVPGATCP